MGIDYSLCAILPRTQSARMLEALRKILSAESRRRIKNLEWMPAMQVNETQARGILGLDLNESESENSSCFGLHVKLERELEPQLGEHRFKCFERPDTFGCMWTSIFASPEHVLIQMTAATSGMSRILQESTAIHKLWRGFAKDANAVVAYVDLESETGIMLHPRSGTCVIPSDEPLSWFEGQDFDLDEMVRVMRQTNAI
jgi:hypothetical protein